MAESIEVDLIIEALTKGFDKTAGELKRLNTETDKPAPQKAANRWTELASKLSVAQAAFGITAGVARQAYQVLEQGAGLVLARDRFERLTESIGATSDAMLGDLKTASGGMMSDANMIASASDIISLGLADNQKDVVDLASLVSQLGWDMNQVILTFANNSKMRLDALGLSVEDVEDKMKSFEAQGYSTDKAFDMAVIEAGKDKLALLKSEADSASGALKRLGVRAENAKNSILEIVGDRAGQALLGFVNMLDSFEEAEVDLNKALEEGLINQREYTQLINGMGLPAYNARIKEVRTELRANAAAQEQVNEQMEMHERHLRRQEAASDNAARALIRNSAAMDDMRQAGELLFGSAWKEFNREARKQESAARDAAEAIREEQIEIRRLADAAEHATQMEFNSNFVQALKEGGQEYGRWVTTVQTTGGLTEAQSSNLEELREEQERLTSAQISLQGGTAGLGLSQEELNERLQENAEKLANVSAAMAPLAGITEEVIGSTTRWQVDAEKMNQTLFDQIAATSDSEVSIAAAAYALGLYDETQLETALNAAIIKEKIDDLAKAFVGGEITAGDMREQMDQIVENSPYTAEVEAITDQAIASIDKVRSKLSEIKDKTVTVTTKYREEGNKPGGGAGSSAGDSNGGNGGNRAFGGLGTRGMTYLVGERGPEYFTPTSTGRFIPLDQAGNGRNGGTVNITNYNNNDHAAALAYAQAERIRQERLNRS